MGDSVAALLATVDELQQALLQEKEASAELQSQARPPCRPAHSFCWLAALQEADRRLG